MVTQKEVIELLRDRGLYLSADRAELANRIESEGIAPPDGWVLVTISDLKYLSNRLGRAGFIFKSEVPDSRNHRGCTYILDAIEMAEKYIAAAPKGVGHE